jgi:predicted kinase
MRTLNLMCGLPFSGKTTLARALVEHLNCGYVSLDDINEERGLAGGAAVPVEEWERTHQIALGRLDALMEQGVDVVLDDTNNLRILRDRFRNTALGHGYATRLLYLVPPAAVIRARTTVGTGYRTLDIFQAPQPDESPIVLAQVREPQE